MKKKTYFSGLSKETFLLTLTSFFADISTEMLYPILPIFLTQTLRASGSIVGIVSGVTEATQNIVQGFSGFVADKFHKRKKVAIIGYLIAAVSKPLVGLSTGWQMVLGTRFLDRLGTGIRSAPRDALIAASADEKSRGKAFGLEGIGDNLGAFVGPLIAIWLLLGWQLEIRKIFYLAFIPGLLAVLMMFLVKEKRAISGVGSKLVFSFKRFPKAYWRYILVTALFGLGNSSNSFLILRTKELGVSLGATILIYAFFNLVAALISYPSGKMSDKWGRKNILLVCFGVFLVTYVGFALTKNVWVIGVLFIFYGLYQGIFRSVGKAMATDLVLSEFRASGLGIYSATVGISGLMASIVGGYLWTVINPSALFVYGATFAILGIVLLIPLHLGVKTTVGVG